MGRGPGLSNGSLPQAQGIVGRIREMGAGDEMSKSCVCGHPVEAHDDLGICFYLTKVEPMGPVGLEPYYEGCECTDFEPCETSRAQERPQGKEE